MNLIDKQLEKIKQEKRLGLMTHVVVGYPSLKETIRIIKTMVENGVDLVELQIPFSDPLADGPTIMRACEKSLANGTKVKDSFMVMTQLASRVSIPLLFMGYYNNIFKYGVKKFCSDSKKAGATGLIIPDMPLEEEQQEHFMEYCQEFGLKNIRVLSPVSTVDRIEKNAKVGNGFVYCTAKQGITGVQKNLDSDLISYLKKVRQFFKIPVAVGFGISKKEHLQIIKPYANIAVIGSAIINIINKSNSQEIEKNVSSFIQSLVINRV